MVEEPVSQRELARRDEHRYVDICITAWPHALLDLEAFCYPSGGNFDGRGGTRTVRCEDDEHPGQDVDVEVTSVEARAMKTDFAAAWLAELHDVLALFLDPLRPTWEPGWWTLYTASTISHLWDTSIDAHVNDRQFRLNDHRIRALTRLASTATRNWPVPPKKGQVVDGVTVGERSSSGGVECVACHEWIYGTVDDKIRRIDGNPYHLRASDSHPACYYKKWRELHDDSTQGIMRDEIDSDS